MKILRRNKGQTLIETALMLFVLMLIALGTVEFARAWHTKNSLKNAARQGARVAVVTSGIINETRTIPSTIPALSTCGTTLSGNDRVFCYIWNSPGIKYKASAPIKASATLTITQVDTGNSTADPDDIVTVTVSDYFDFIVGGSSSSIWWWSDQTFTSDATMRYE